MKHLSLNRMTGLAAVSLALYGVARADAPMVTGDCADCYTPATQDKATKAKRRLAANPSLATGEQSTAEDVHGLSYVAAAIAAPTPSVVATPETIAPATPAAAATSPAASTPATPQATTTPTSDTTPAASGTTPASTSPAPQATGPMTKDQAIQILSTGKGDVAAAQAAYYGPGGFYSQAASVQAASTTAKCSPSAKVSQYPVPVMTSSNTCDWSCYTGPMQASGASATQITNTVNQLSFDYNYRRWQSQPGAPLDVPVTIWGWDPYITMQLRQSYGYTSIPDGNNPNNPSAWVAPGLLDIANLPTANQPGGISVSMTTGPWNSVAGACH